MTEKRTTYTHEVPQWAVECVTELSREIEKHCFDGLLGDEARELIARALAEAAKPKWQPIETAPKDTVVLTDRGTAMHYAGQWFLCTAGGAITSCADWGREASEISPSVWAPLPDAPEVG